MHSLPKSLSLRPLSLPLSLSRSPFSALPSLTRSIASCLTRRLGQSCSAVRLGSQTSALGLGSFHRLGTREERQAYLSQATRQHVHVGWRPLLPRNLRRGQAATDLVWRPVSLPVCLHPRQRLLRLSAAPRKDQLEQLLLQKPLLKNISRKPLPALQQEVLRRTGEPDPVMACK